MVLKNKLLLYVCLLLFTMSLQAQYTTKDIETYIETYSDLAVKKMEDYGIPASITLAQGILESAAGTSDLARNANNHFGIKCHAGWEGKTYFKDDDKKNECFRSYASVEDSYNDHSDFLKKPRYASLFDLSITDYQSWAKGLKKCGYATDPNYAERLILLIEKYALNQYDTKTYAEAKLKKDSPDKSKQNQSQGTVVNKEYTSVDYPYTTRSVYLNNKTYFVFAKKGETYYDIAVDVQLTVSQLRKYNDVKQRNYRPKENEIVYIAKKAKSNQYVGTHIVAIGESLRDIAQRYGVREKSLRRLNNLSKDSRIPSGTTIMLK